MTFHIPETTKRNREIFRLRRKGMKTGDIAKRMNVTTSRVNQILNHPGAEESAKRVPDMDTTDSVTLLKWAIPPQKVGIVERAAQAFPSKPRGYVEAYRWLCVIANNKLRGQDFEDQYDRLPEWARCRNQFPVRACVPDGQKFRKSAPKTNLLDLLPVKPKRLEK